jgi:hypothetical protein
MLNKATNKYLEKNASTLSEFLRMLKNMSKRYGFDWFTPTASGAQKINRDYIKPLKNNGILTDKMIDTKHLHRGLIDTSEIPMGYSPRIEVQDLSERPPFWPSYVPYPADLTDDYLKLHKSIERAGGAPGLGVTTTTRRDPTKGSIYFTYHHIPRTVTTNYYKYQDNFPFISVPMHEGGHNIQYTRHPRLSYELNDNAKPFVQSATNKNFNEYLASKNALKLKGLNLDNQTRQQVKEDLKSYISTYRLDNIRDFLHASPNEQIDVAQELMNMKDGKPTYWDSIRKQYLKEDTEYWNSLKKQDPERKIWDNIPEYLRRKDN